MIKLVNNSSNKHIGFYLNSVRYALSPNGHQYFDDNFISEIESVVDINSDLEMFNFAGTVIARVPMSIVGSGQGLNKTTTGVYGVVVTEDFGIDSELFVHFTFDPLIDKTFEPILNFGFAPVTSEVGKKVSAEISMFGHDGGSIISTPPTTIKHFTDLPIPDTALLSSEATMTVPVSELGGNNTGVSFKIKRIAATDSDLIGDVALSHFFVDYRKYLI